jgi:hypothetical protein
VAFARGYRAAFPVRNGDAAVRMMDETRRRSGSALRMPADVLEREAQASPPLRAILLRYVQAYLNSATQSAACNRVHLLGQRLARWLLTARDRTGSDRLPLTHELIAVMLGVRRAGVTVAARPLHGKRDLVAEHRLHAQHALAVDQADLDRGAIPHRRHDRDHARGRKDHGLHALAALPQRLVEDKHLRRQMRPQAVELRRREQIEKSVAGGWHGSSRGWRGPPPARSAVLPQERLRIPLQSVRLAPKANGNGNVTVLRTDCHDAAPRGVPIFSLRQFRGGARQALRLSHR